ncbi:FAD-dependent monooxygenase [Actinophytocola algeriensis]|uniref:2-polyprenyl-6-methoxyphenol hydroxylase-like FAD-dependent oxidoreductase n=1 Tax=Actinophytocola algeriensis TaxID=1768010 RepID=A0A7W7Q6H7_9PSEU|nr:FAD-dependent monooxygenase [Actinophytocola algeriensis]MBB4907945.1 2-polyprenyl-6-methoxyphenol hydroxylase-like FAD-dependent oxidoreductase [Actinophytocola algeriensis]MBE1479975.1 2-polyprenyl-6-methoxyphenol hydroxylase-like FAD-dependent oxidoreductase [Actinophytocola algeriensis]
MNILISGAGIAGPSLALRLAGDGHAVTVVEKAPCLRTGGQAVDFKGAVHRTVLERMGILDDVLARQTGGADQTVVDATGTPLVTIPGEFTGGDVEIRRGDLAAILYERTRNACEYVFGDSITSLTDTGSGVHVTFERSAPRTFDLVVGADGIHSNVRRLAFGPERDYVHHLGHHYALATLADLAGTGAGLMYNEPGRMVALGGPKAQSFFVFASGELTYDRYDAEQQKKLVIDAYRGGGWRVPEVLAAVPAATDFFLDSLSRVDVDDYAKGRVVLLGDAAYGNTLGGFGSGLAVVGAYVLAGELRRAGHDAAFRRYTELMRGYAKVAKKGSAGPFLAPRTKRGIRMRNWVFKRAVLFGAMMKMTDRFATDIELPDYST